MQTSPRPRVVAAVVLGSSLALAGTTAAGAWTGGYGHVGARDGLLRGGCRAYAYHYVVKPGSSDWTLETWLYDPRGRPRGAGDHPDPAGHGKARRRQPDRLPGARQAADAPEP